MNSIRKAKKSELEEIARIFKRVFNEKPYKDNWTHKSALNRIKHEFKVSEIFVYVKEKKIIAMVIISKTVGPKRNLAEIKDFAIIKEYRNKGIGSEFLQEIEKRLLKKNYQSTYLETYIKSKAVDFYKKNKYKISKHAVLMNKKLK